MPESRKNKQGGRGSIEEGTSSSKKPNVAEVQIEDVTEGATAIMDEYKEEPSLLEGKKC